MSNAPPFPASIMGHGDETWRPARGQRVTIISTQVDRDNAARAAYREASSRAATQQAAVPPMGHLAAVRGPRAVLVENLDGSAPGPVAPPLMTNLQFEGQIAQPRALPLRPPEPVRPSREQQRGEWERLALNGAWAERDAEDAADQARREAQYWRHLQGAMRR